MPPVPFWLEWAGARARKILGIAANAAATAAVVCGVAGALANGTILLHNGIGQAAGTELPAATGYGLILAAMAVAFMASASSGLRRGIRWLSVANIGLAIGLLMLLLMLTDAVEAYRALLGGMAAYARLLPSWSLQPLAVDGSTDWSRGWTITYLLWWIAWARFVGIFIARISRGRSIRAYVFGVLGVPVLFSFAWFAVLGGGAVVFDKAHDGLLSAAVFDDYTAPLFLWFDAMPAGAVPYALLLVLQCVAWLRSAWISGTDWEYDPGDESPAQRR